MRLLERCSNSWPMPEISAAIEDLRQAFSVDITKPFELKPGLLYGSPGRSDSLSPSPNETSYIQQHHETSQMPTTYNSYQMLPPSVNEATSRAEFAPNQSYMSQGDPQVSFDGNTRIVTSLQPPVWNPSRIFENFDQAFGNHAVMSMAQTPPLQPTPLPVSSYVPQQSTNPTFTNYGQGILEVPDYRGQMQSPPTHLGIMPTYQQPQPQLQPQPQPPSLVPPSMWVEAVATATIGNKRRWQGHGREDRSGMSTKRTR